MRKAAVGAIARFLAISASFVTTVPAGAGEGTCLPELVDEVSARAADAPGGAVFAQAIEGRPIERRDEAAAASLVAGNLPHFLRRLRPVELGGNGAAPKITLCVAPDYLAIGSDADFLRMPLGMPTAVDVASRLGFILPTRKIVDAIYAQADVRLEPRPMQPTSEMVGTAYFRRHNGTIEEQRSEHGARLGALLAGHKKDLVLTPRLWTKLGRVAIYGWHGPDGRAIQPLSTVHGAGYADYSHGVRLVSAVVSVDGERRSIYDVLSDPALASILSDEGPIPRLGELVVAIGGTADGPAIARRLARGADLASAGDIRLARGSR